MTQRHDLIDAIDLLCEARNLADAAEMAVEAIADAGHRNAMARLIGTVADRLTDVDIMLSAIQERAQR